MKNRRLSTILLAVVFAGQFLLGTVVMAGQGPLQGAVSILECADQPDGQDARIVPTALAAVPGPASPSPCRYPAQGASHTHARSLSGHGYATGPPTS